MKIPQLRKLRPVQKRVRCNKNFLTIRHRKQLHFTCASFLRRVDKPGAGFTIIFIMARNQLFCRKYIPIGAAILLHLTYIIMQEGN